MILRILYWNLKFCDSCTIVKFSGRNVRRQKNYSNFGSMSINSESSEGKALQFSVVAECSFSKARTSLMRLPHYEVELPTFMPVGTQGTMKGLTPEQVADAGAQIILGNTYHLGTRPGKTLIEEHGGLHEFMHWKKGLLTDSGGFQMVSLLKLAQITEEGVKFQSPYDGSECMLTPEESIHIQNAIGADIMMQLDDVVDVRETDYERFEVAVGRTTRWLDRCMKANQNPQTQNLFPIIQGGLFPDLRKKSLQQLIERDAPGYAIGGLSGGEDKNKFWPTIDLCTSVLPKNKPRYCMGVGFPVDILICCALGVDMFDCVYPTRTARFGCAIVNGGQINLKNQEYKFDFTPIEKDCSCSTCKNYTKAYIRTIIHKETVACHLISVHNIFYMMRLMSDIRESIKKGRFVEFVKDYLAYYYKDGNFPEWVVDSLKAVNISLEKKGECDYLSVDFDDDVDPLEKGRYLERMSGFRESNFNHGYRQALLEDHVEASENGRRDGFRIAITTHQRMEASNAAAAAAASNFLPPQSHPLNPTWILSEWQGVLLASQSMRRDLNEEDSRIIESLINDINALKKKIYSNDTLLKELCEESDSSAELSCMKQSTNSKVHDHDLFSVAPIIKECKRICDKIYWKIPSHLSFLKR